MLRHVLNGLAKRTQHFQRNFWMFMCPDPWHATSEPSAHALVQQCCENRWTWPNEHNIMQQPKGCTKNLTVFKFNPTHRNRNGQANATCYAQQCRKMLRWSVVSVWRGLKTVIWLDNCEKNNRAARAARFLVEFLPNYYNVKFPN